MLRLLTRVGGIALLPASPLLAVWAAYVFRNESSPELRGWTNNFAELASAARDMILYGHL